jgi:hypothetical protein
MLPWLWPVNSALSYGFYLTRQQCHFWKICRLYFYWICIYTFRISLVHMHTEPEFLQKRETHLSTTVHMPYRHEQLYCKCWVWDSHSGSDDACVFVSRSAIVSSLAYSSNSEPGSCMFLRNVGGILPPSIIYILQDSIFLYCKRLDLKNILQKYSISSGDYNQMLFWATSQFSYMGPYLQCQYICTNSPKGTVA